MQKRSRAKGYRQATPRGAARPAQRFQSLQKVARALKQVTLLGVLGAAGVAMYHYGGMALSTVMRHPVEEVKVEGSFVQLSREEATALISRAIDREFVELDLTELKRDIERHPWVERAVVARSLPSALTVTLIEQVPIARWGEVGFLNQRGEVIHTSQAKTLEHLPQLMGRESESTKIMQQYQDLSRVLRSRSLSITRLWVDHLGTWRIALEGGAELTLGKDELPEKIQRFLWVYDEHLIQNFEAVARVDLRYANGLAVAWSDEYEVSIEKTS
ncbi:cell division protein FtsQ/DivIB [Gilvimarinus algae]|uniref:Cell division protein FtsQ n=1 Tax=Gilvimarinus algae TaxID=3058037 RepID=A0ABT8THG5_9GAMM|nr:cell division protein FtsQ/DivIB [Gilvimarinus sp. SDUM040014]MDO3382808.1 cell division protein FtsQ/DivIB [Gilvimarinus sp. SDUM040014]